MVLYYSATGNTEYIATEVAKLLGDECVDLLERIKTNDNTPIHSDKPLVICAPVYVCEMPRFLTKHLKKQSFTGSKEVYFIFTSGGYCGVSGQLAKWMFRKKGMKYRGHAEFKMPRNYVINDAYPMNDATEVETRLRNATKNIEPVASTIKQGGKLKARHIFLLETIITVPFNPVWCKYKLLSKDFYTTDKCVGCNKCEKLCPLNNISMKDKKPLWGDNCTHCMACIGNCPTQAIEYGEISIGKDRYNFKKYKYAVDSDKK